MNGKIAGVGSYVPSRRLTNSDLEKLVETSDEWITSRTGIKERRICGENEAASDMAVAAAQRALESSGLKPEDIDLLLVGTVTPDFRLPSQACMVQKKLGMVNAAAMDIVAACAGFLHGLATADAYIKAGQFKRVMVIGVEKLSSITDYTDRNTCVLFGDGAGAAVVVASDEERGIISTFLKSDGRYGELLWIPDGGTERPLQSLNGQGRVYLEMNGSEVFKHAVRQMVEASEKVIKEAGLTPADVTLMVPHQANIRIIQSTAKRLAISMEKVYLNIDKVGNTSSASVPIALDEVIKSGRVKRDDIILMTAFGGGLTWASALIKW
ncbi:MAG: ketoacyl-ACP synthase III [Candidatus Zixiibacteriota bacterium]|nr:MAG: ketoacyl-ACP synthase III [candidate division Zixibacteria bacterium]